jgi:hypothetical protein
VQDFMNESITVKAEQLVAMPTAQHHISSGRIIWSDPAMRSLPAAACCQLSQASIAVQTLLLVSSSTRLIPPHAAGQSIFS